VNLSLDWDGSRARIRLTGYLSLQAGENVSVLLRDLGRMDLDEIDLDLSRCSPVCIGALESLLEVKFRLSGHGVRVKFRHSPPTLSKVFQIMGLRADGEVPADEGPHSRRAVDSNVTRIN